MILESVDGQACLADEGRGGTHRCSFAGAVVPTGEAGLAGSWVAVRSGMQIRAVGGVIVNRVKRALPIPRRKEPRKKTGPEVRTSNPRRPVDAKRCPFTAPRTR